MADISVIKMPDNTSYNLKDASAREALERKVDLISDIASGNPCIFESSTADMPLKQVKLNWTPTQSGTGDPSPTNVRPISGVSGVNVWQGKPGTIPITWDADSNGKYIGESGNIGDSENFHYSDLLLVTNGDYAYSYHSESNTNRTVRIHGYDSSGTWVEQLAYLYSTKNGDFEIPFTVSSGIRYIRISTPKYAENNILAGTEVVETVSIVFPALGKNLFDKDTVIRRDGYTLNDQGQEQSSGISGYTKSITPVVPGAEYTFNGEPVSPTTPGYYWRLYFYDKNGNFVSRTDTKTKDDIPCTFTVPSGCYGLGFQYSQGYVEFSTFMLNSGSIAEPYEPYTNTVYGGSLNLTTGVLTATMGMVTINSSNAGMRTDYGYYGRVITCANQTVSNNQNGVKCSHAINGGVSVAGNRFSVPSNGTIWVSIPACETEEGAQAAIDAGDIQVAYNLRTPQTWQLTPQQIQTLIGTNVIWADTNGQIDVEQFIDLQGIKDYIDKQQAENVHDVQINGSSIISNGVANIPIASTNAIGAIQLGYGLTISGTKLYTQPSTDAQIQAGEATYAIIGPATQHKAVFYGLAKAAGADLANETVTTGIYPDSSKAAIQNMLGITSLFSTEESSTATVAHTINSTFMMNGKLHRATVAIAVGDAVEVGTNCEVVKADEVFVKNTDYPSTSNVGVIKVNSAAAHGLQVFTNGTLATKAAVSTDIKTGTDGYKPIVSNYVGYAAFYGLSRAAGVDLANETITFGTYPETSKTAIRSLIGAAAASDVSSKLDTSLKGAASGLAELDANGKVPAAQLPSYVDDVLEYSGSTNFPGTGETGKIYVDTSTNITYRWSGSTYVPIGSDLALGETSSTAYRGDRGATAYSHATDSSRLTTAQSAGLYKIATTAEGHIASVTAVVKADIIGLGIPAQDTTYESKTAASGGTTVSLVTTGEKYTWNNKYSKPSGGIPASDLENGVIPDVPVQDVEVNGTSVLTNGVASIPMASSTAFGVVKVTDYTYGLAMRSDGNLRTYLANTDQVKAGTEEYRPIVPIRQHQSVFYGLAKAAGDTTQSASSNTVGTYTTEAKAAIQDMLGIIGTNNLSSDFTTEYDIETGYLNKIYTKVSDVQVNGTSIINNKVANIPLASTSTPGVIQIGSRLAVENDKLLVRLASANQLKAGTESAVVLSPVNQHSATFYGLAKAAGDSTQASSNNAVGTYTSEAQTAIRSMIGAAANDDLNLKADAIVNYSEGIISYIPDGKEGFVLDNYNISIEPKQRIEGDPSPTNVNQISGIDNIIVYQTGKNVFYIDIDLNDFTTNINTGNDTTIKRTNLVPNNIYVGVDKNNKWTGSSVNNTLQDYSSNAIGLESNTTDFGIGICCVVHPSTTYTLSYNNHGCTVSIAEYEEDGTFIQGTDFSNINPKTFITHKYTRFLLVIFSSADIELEYVYASDIQLEYGAHVTNYTDGSKSLIYTKAFGSNIGTIYRGTYGKENNSLYVYNAIKTKKLNSFQVISTNTNTVHYRDTNFFSNYVAPYQISNVLCDIAKYQNNEDDTVHFSIPTTITKQLDIWLPIGTSLDTTIQVFTPEMTGIYEFSGLDNITLYRGENYFFTNASYININYLADTKSYIDYNIPSTISQLEQIGAQAAIEVIRL